MCKKLLKAEWEEKKIIKIQRFNEKRVGDESRWICCDSRPIQNGKGRECHVNMSGIICIDTKDK